MVCGFKPTTTSTMNSVTTPKDDVTHKYDGFKPTSSSTMNSVTTPKDDVTHTYDGFKPAIYIVGEKCYPRVVIPCRKCKYPTAAHEAACIGAWHHSEN
jgi:hypothetical protein